MPAGGVHGTGAHAKLLKPRLYGKEAHGSPAAVTACELCACLLLFMSQAAQSPAMQVGNMDADHEYWGRPEDMEAAGVARPAYLVNATHPGSDMAGMAAAGLASASMVSSSCLRGTDLHC